MSKLVLHNNNQNIVCFIQARFLSSRLMGKVLKPLGNFSVLELCILRLMRCPEVNKIVVLTGDISSNIPIITECKRIGVDYYQGPEEDVLKRFVVASEQYDPSLIIRITADCPLIDPKILSMGIKKIISKEYDYVSNTLPPTFPDGLDFEIFTYRSLKEIEKTADTKFDREHVTPILRRDKKYRKYNISYPQDYSNVRWTLDNIDDLNLLQKIVFSLPNPIDASFEECLELYKAENLNLHESQFAKRNEGAMQSKSKKLYTRAKQIMPGGTSLLSKRPEMFDPKNWPAYFNSCKGIMVTSIDNEEYMDFSTMSVGSCTLGYGNKVVDDAVIQSVKKGVSSSLNSPEEVHAAELILELHPWASMIRFARTGGEANAIAVRIARAATGKNNVVLCGYHGWHDWYLSANLGSEKALDDMLLPGLSTKGVDRNIKQSTKTFTYGNKNQFLDAIDDNTACVVMEPCRNSKPDIPFLSYIRNICTKKSIVLILDECSSGFRENWGGLHLKYGIIPDLCMVGKAIANGYALTAVLGKNEIMEVAQDTFISSTFWTERLGPTAAIACIQEMERCKSYEILPDIGKKIKNCWRNAAQNTLQVEIGGFDAIPSFSFKCDAPLLAKTLFTRYMLEEGFLATTAFYASIMHKNENIMEYEIACEKVFKKINDIFMSGESKHLSKNEICHSGFKRLN